MVLRAKNLSTEWKKKKMNRIDEIIVSDIELRAKWLVESAGVWERKIKKKMSKKMSNDDKNAFLPEKLIINLLPIRNQYQICSDSFSTVVRFWFFHWLWSWVNHTYTQANTCPPLSAHYALFAVVKTKDGRLNQKK